MVKGGEIDPADYLTDGKKALDFTSGKAEAMRNRLSYREEKQNAFYYITGLIEYMDNVPTTALEREQYRREIDRLSKRYGLREELRGSGYDIEKGRTKSA